MSSATPAALTLALAALVAAAPASQGQKPGEKIAVVHVTTEGKSGRGDAWFARGLGARVDWKRGDRRTLVVDDLKKKYTYDSQTGIVTVAPSTFAADAADLFAGFTLAGALNDLARGAGDRRDEVKSDSNRVDGRKLFRLRTTSVEDSPAIWVDADTERVVRIEAWQRSIDGERDRVNSQVDYPDPEALDRRLFSFEAPPGARIEEAVDINDEAPEVKACAQNLRQIGLALLLYARDHKVFPEALRPELEAYITRPAIFRCPEDRSPAGRGPEGSYTYRRPPPRLPRAANPVGVVLVECDHHPGLSLRLNADCQVGVFRRVPAGEPAP